MWYLSPFFIESQILSLTHFVNGPVIFMASNKYITVEVAYARPDTQRILTVQVEADTTIETVIERSGILELFPEIDLMKQKVGVFSKAKKLTDQVKEGDRIE